MTEQEMAISRAYGRGFSALRRLAGYTSQGSLAKTAGGISQTTISEIESGKRALKAYEIEWWCAFFAERIPGYTVEDCVRLLREAAGNEFGALPSEERQLVRSGRGGQSH